MESSLINLDLISDTKVSSQINLPPDAKSMTQDEIDTHIFFMREALAMANLALNTNETPVGCVLVDPILKKIVARGMNATNRSYNGTRHAEFIAVDELLSSGPKVERSDADESKSAKRKRGENGSEGNDEKDDESESLKRGYGPEDVKYLDLYVTIEPCIMCASLLQQFGIRKVWYGAVNDKFGGNGGVLNIHVRNGKFNSNDAGEDEAKDGRNQTVEEERTEKHEGDYEVSGGWLREEAIVILRRFYVQENGRAPEPRNKKERILKLEVEPIIDSRVKGDETG
ncbi:putative trna-specific adenosine deaminase subunit tad2 protein [Botrytis fragariae]|uniref:Putative trna-specific adenosine deaminase subunit tad2 protein n=1 Tax=Botrytis fragariae TaxID=1964551 RepID=A0A8H6EMG3_9HELO|nr:putative trna-specific adenosine deaminase subunit tad2 protein [Botrytis fragariae]KAF5877275.1 putative trna-specific adenosine deaminase subunit tad2 protein [Botrytis fragariae]